MQQPRESYICALCGRHGNRGFLKLEDQSRVCRSSKACERRIRATGQVGVGAMRSYAR